MAPRLPQQQGLEDQRATPSVSRGVIFFSFFFFFKILFIDLTERERAHKQGERQREREKQTPFQTGSLTRGSIPGPQDHDLSPKQMLNR